MSVDLRKEKVVLIGAALILGFLVWRDLRSSSVVDRRRPKGTLELVPGAVPDVSLSVRDPGRRLDAARDLFSPPKDTAPLPPLDLEPPPLEPLAALAPPTAFGPAPAHMGRFLRRTPQVQPVPELFEVEAEPEELEDTGADAEPIDAAEQWESYRRLYDWVRAPRLIWGYIRNAERYGLADRPGETIQFVEVVPETGLERFSGSVIPYERERVEGFGFAETPANWIEQERHAFGDSLRAAQLEPALELADACVRMWLESDRALPVAEEMYNLAATVAHGDARPQLGLAQCYEAGFRFEEALAAYRELSGSASGTVAALANARLADLYVRFRLFDKAEAHYAEALRVSSAHWEPNWRFGRHLIARRRGAEAVAFLATANRSEPTEPGLQDVRSQIRTDLGWAQVQAGDLEGAIKSFQRALSNDASYQPALAGLLSARLYAPGAGGAPGTPRSNGAGAAHEDVGGAGFDLSLAQGLAAIEGADWEHAERLLESAAASDPFRAYLALRSLSWLAEVTGNPDQALEFAEAAVRNDPVDPYSLYQLGRLLAAAQDLEGARARFQEALDQDLDFVDALVGLGEVARARADHAGAARYFERALAIDPEQPLVHSLAGYNSLALGDPTHAAEAFEKALELSPELASAKSGLAWCKYVAGDATEATTLYAELAESRRHLGEGDPFSLYADAQIRRIRDHLEKEIWFDGFERAAGRLGNDWRVEHQEGLDVALLDGRVHFEGNLPGDELQRIFRVLSSSDFVSFEAQVTVSAGTKAEAGLFVSLERAGRAGSGEPNVSALVSVLRNDDGKVQARIVKQGERDAPPVDLPDTPWPADTPVAVRIDRIGEGSETRMTLFVDGVPVMEDVKMAALGRSSAELRFGAFVHGRLGRPVHVFVDDVQVVRRVR